MQSCKGTVWTRRNYRKTDGLLESIKSGFSAGGVELQDLSYAFDNIGNLTTRTDAYWTHQGTSPTTTALSETFGYDTLNRLVSTDTGTGSDTVAAYYDNGNILWKKDVSGTKSANYTCNAARPHAVTSAFGNTMTYDANGLMSYRSNPAGTPTVWGLGRCSTWNRSNMVKWIFSGLNGSEFEYDGSNSRVLEIRKASGQTVEKKIFCPGFEQFFENIYANNTWTWKAKTIRVHIGAPDGVAGVFEYTPGQSSMANAQKLTLLFTDHLGSTDLSITIPGNTLLAFAATSTRQKFSYDPWGQRRDETDWVGAHELFQHTGKSQGNAMGYMRTRLRR